MKNILILANNQANVEKIKAEILDVDTYKVHEINDLIVCNYNSKGLDIITWETDSKASKVDEKQFDYVIIYSEFLKCQKHFMNDVKDVPDMIGISILPNWRRGWNG